MSVPPSQVFQRGISPSLIEAFDAYVAASPDERKKTTFHMLRSVYRESAGYIVPPTAKQRASMGYNVTRGLLLLFEDLFEPDKTLAKDHRKSFGRVNKVCSDFVDNADKCKLARAKLVGHKRDTPASSAPSAQDGREGDRAATQGTHQPSPSLTPLRRQRDTSVDEQQQAEASRDGYTGDHENRLKKRRMDGQLGEQTREQIEQPPDRAAATGQPLGNRTNDVTYPEIMVASAQMQIEANGNALEWRETAVKIREDVVTLRENAVELREQDVSGEERRVRDLRQELEASIASAREHTQKAQEHTQKTQEHAQKARDLAPLATERDSNASNKEDNSPGPQTAATDTVKLESDGELAKALVDYILDVTHPHLDVLHHGLVPTALALGPHVAHANGWGSEMFCFVLLSILRAVCRKAASDLPGALAQGMTYRLMPYAAVPPLPRDDEALRAAVHPYGAALGDSTDARYTVPATRLLQAAGLAGIHISAWDVVQDKMVSWAEELHDQARAMLPYDYDRMMVVWKEKVVEPFGDAWSKIHPGDAV